MKKIKQLWSSIKERYYTWKIKRKLKNKDSSDPFIYK